MSVLPKNTTPGTLAELELTLCINLGSSLLNVNAVSHQLHDKFEISYKIIFPEMVRDFILIICFIEFVPNR